MAESVFQSQLGDRAVLDGLLGGLSGAGLPAQAMGALEGPAASMGLEEAVERIRTGRTNLADPMPAEAIVMLHGFPSLLIQNGAYEAPRNPEWRRRLDPNRAKIAHVIANTGRVDLVGHPDHAWVGTAWRVDETTFVTNRHVAAVFADLRSGAPRIRPGVEVFIDRAEEHGSRAALEMFVDQILHIEPREAGGIDMAILRVSAAAADMAGPPIELALGPPRADVIGVVGYPARDFRNPEDAMDRIFGNIFNVKRLAPGHIMDADFAPKVFTHNATTLGGNSGSVVFDVETGRAIGLHFAGSAERQNFAATADAVAEVLRRRDVPVRAPALATTDGAEAEGLASRQGYDPAFIGEGALRVPLPQLNALQQKALARTGDGSGVLRYRHFSVVQNAARRLAFFAAVNIDGDSLRRPRRLRRFNLDPRLAEDAQAGEALYAGNDLDRGHLIRRLDPCWGDRDAADEANRDSMFFPNIAPQHKDLNQRLWLGLEDHILGLTDQRDARVSVFVGNIFGPADPIHQETGIPVPLGFWKIVASLGRARQGRSVVPVLEAQAFVMFQDHLLEPEDLEIVFGRDFETHQITVEELERITGLDFHVLRAADTFGMPPEMRAEMVAGAGPETPHQPMTAALKPLRGFEDIVGGTRAQTGDALA